MNLIVGATGLLGGEICRLLAGQGKAVRSLVRNTSNPEKVDAPGRPRRRGGARRPEGPLLTGGGLPWCERGRVDGVIDAVEAGRRFNRERRPARTAEPHRGCRGGWRQALRPDFISERRRRLSAAVRETCRRGSLAAKPHDVHDPSADIFHGGVAEPRLGLRPGQRHGPDLRRWPQQDQLDLFPGRRTVCGGSTGQSSRDQRRHQIGRSGRVESPGSRAPRRAGGGQDSRCPARARRSSSSATSARQPTPCSSRLPG